MADALETLASLLRPTGVELCFTMLEIGAVPLGGAPEPFYRLLALFPGSRIVGFEVDEAVCRDMNEQAPPGVRYYPVALGRRAETRSFYLTAHPMCASLYRPNEELIRLYQNFEVAYLKGVTTVQTRSVDDFVRDYAIGPVDFIKIDIQGAELEAFAGGVQTLRHTLAIVSEVEFIPHYVDQPLFGDVCQLLDRHDLMFHKFLGLAGRSLRPVVINNNRSFPSQHIWSDAVFVRHVQRLDGLSDAQCLKLAVLALVYGSPDLTHFSLAAFDHRRGTQLSVAFLQAFGA
jgi:FkbM family methyltransferase